MATEIDTQTIVDAATQPAEVKADDLMVKAHPLPDVIAADRYLATKEAAAKKGGGLQFTKLRMPGARGGEPSC
jgi:hypothetical protein